VKVLDFGLAKLLDDDQAAISGIHRTELTEVGVPYGTATYAAPEQARGDRVDKRADIFSLGVLLYEMLSGTWPFRGKTTIDVRHAVLYDPPRPISEVRGSAVPARLEQIVVRALAKEPKHRYQNMEDLRNELRQVLQEIDAGAAAYQGVAPEPPRHLAGGNPVSRGPLAEINYTKRIADHFSEPCHSFQTRHTRDAIHYRRRSRKEESRNPVFPQLEQRSGGEFL
jgi:serine/threonine-protein kinase